MTAAAPTWSGAGAQGIRFGPEDRWLVPVGMLWTLYSGVYTAMCFDAGAPAVMWMGSGVFTGYGLWLAGLRLVFEARARRRCTYGATATGLEIRRSDGRVTRFVPWTQLAGLWLESHPDGTGTLWCARRGARSPCGEPFFSRVTEPDTLVGTAARLARDVCDGSGLVVSGLSESPPNDPSQEQP